MSISLYFILNLFFLLNYPLRVKSIRNNIKYLLYSSKTNSLDEESYELKSKFYNNIIELESNYIITKISWIKRENYKFNYLLGVFEGANDPDFKDAIPIGIIKENENLDLINYLKINTKTSYKYIRYIPPNKNNSDISPIKVFGYKIPEKRKYSKQEKKYFQSTNLPLISIYTEDSKDISEKSIEINCKILIVNEGRIETNETAKIKVKDETRAYLSPKIPYSINFSSAQKILGFKGKYRNWELISNYFDRSLLRNLIALKISELMKFEYTVKCKPLDVIINGNFKGNYYICDPIEVGNNRVNISKTSESNLIKSNNNGGYLLEIDGEYYNGKKHFKSNKGIYIRIIYPKDNNITPEQENYIIENFNKIEKEVYNGNLENFDLNTYSKQFLLKEFCGDLTHLYKNFYITNNANSKKLFFGPIWDFETSFDNDKMLIPTNEKPNFCFNYYSSSGTMKELTIKFIRNKDIIGYIQNLWNNLCDTVLKESALIDFIEEQRIYLKESAELNFLKWDNFVEEYDLYGFNWGTRDYLFGRKGENFEISVNIIKDYIRKRFVSLNTLINNAISLAN